MAFVDPYSPVSSILGTDGNTTVRLVLTPGAVTQIATSDPQRLYLLVFPGSADLVVTPFADNAGFGWFGSITPGSSPILIHQASYGPLVSLDWYARSAGGSIILVTDCRVKN